MLDFGYYNLDCMVGMKGFPDKYFDLAVVDPPYGIGEHGGCIIWDKCNDGSDQSDAEIAYNSLNNRVDIFRYIWWGMFQGKSITKGTVQQGNKKFNEKRIHPTQKPVNLYRWIVWKYIKNGWKVLDTHTGSASCLIAYHEARLPFVAFEKDRYMYDLSMKRYKGEIAQMSLFDFIES